MLVDLYQLFDTTDQSKYPALTEDEVLSICGEQSLSEEEFQPLKDKLKQNLS